MLEVLPSALSACLCPAFNMLNEVLCICCVAHWPPPSSIFTGCVYLFTWCVCVCVPVLALIFLCQSTNVHWKWREGDHIVAWRYDDNTSETGLQKRKPWLRHGNRGLRHGGGDWIERRKGVCALEWTGAPREKEKGGWKGKGEGEWERNRAFRRCSYDIMLLSEERF